MTEAETGPMVVELHKRMTAKYGGDVADLAGLVVGGLGMAALSQKEGASHRTTDALRQAILALIVMAGKAMKLDPAKVVECAIEFAGDFSNAKGASAKDLRSTLNGLDALYKTQSGIGAGFTFTGKTKWEA